MMKKIPLKFKILIVVVCIILFFAGVLVYVYVERDNLFSSIGSSNVKLDVEHYKGIVEYKGNVNFMFVINNSNVVSNIIFLDKKGVNILSDKNIEGKSIEGAVYSIIEILNNKNLLNKNIILVSYQDNDSVNLINNYINKNLVIFGSSSKVSYEEGKLSSRVLDFGLNSKSSDIDNVKELYKYSKGLLLDDAYNNMNDTSSSSDALVLAKDIYNQLVDYSKGYMDGYRVKVENQEKNDPNGLLITDLKSSNGKSVDSNSWYSITNSFVVAFISVDNHEFCFNGSVDNYKEGSCS